MAGEFNRSVVFMETARKKPWISVIFQNLKEKKREKKTKKKKKKLWNYVSWQEKFDMKFKCFIVNFIYIVGESW